MSLLSLLHSISFTVYICLILYVLVKNPKSVVNRICAAFIFCLAVWSFGNIYIHSPFTTKQTASFLTNATSIGWVCFGSFFLWMMLVFSRKRKILEKKLILYALLFGPCILLIAAQWSGAMLVGFQLQDYGWRTRWSSTIWSYSFITFYLSFMGMGLYLAFNVMRKASDSVKQKQARVIFYSSLTALILGSISDVLIPVLGYFNWPSAASLFGLIWASGLVYSMVKHKFMAVMPITPISNIQTTMFDCLILLSGDGIIVSVNQSGLDLLGYTDGELKGRSVDILLDNSRESKTVLTGIFHQEYLRNRSLVFKSKYGKKIPVVFSSSLLVNSEGGVEGVVCVARDVTELKRSETFNDVLRSISEAALWTYTLYDLLRSIQQQVARLMDARNFFVGLVQDREKSLYRFPFTLDIHPEEVVDPEVSFELRDSFTDYVVKSEKPLLANKERFDEISSRENIRLVGALPLSWLGVPLKTSESGVFGAVVVQSYEDEDAYTENDLYVLSTIANTVAGAVKYKQAEKALRDSEEKYRNLVDNIEDGVFLIHNGRLDFVNDSFCRMVGYSKKELQGMAFRDFILRDDLDMVESYFRKRLEKKPVPSEYSFRMVRKSGGVVFVNIRVGLIHYKDGVATMGTLQNITDSKKVEEEKKILEEKLARSEKMEVLGRLAGGVAHDLNNVLSAIVSYPDLLLMKLPEESPYRRPIQTMQNSGQKAAAIVQDLLTLARRGVSVKEIENLNQVISDYLCSPVFEKLHKYHPGVRVETQLDVHLFNIKGSSIHLGKTIMNLVSNAAEAMPQGGEVLIKTENQLLATPRKGYYNTIDKGEYVVLTVADSGIGIPADDLVKVFEPFYTKKEMGRSGTGLGMAVVWGTVEDHGGFIDVKSVEGEGTTFILYFPVSREQDDHHDDNVSVEDYKGNGEKIMVIDDEDDQREIASEILEELGYEVCLASGGREAVEMLKSGAVGEVDLFVLDMFMEPGIDGLDTFLEILKLKPGARAVITSGFSESGRVKEAQKLGAGAYIKKPYSLEKLGVTVKRELKK